MNWDSEEAKSFRIFIPIGIIAVFFIGVRACRRTPATSEPNAAVQTSSASPQPGEGGGLKIAGSPVAPAQATETSYPDGLDAGRVQYLVEIDSQFSAPSKVTLSKMYDASEITRLLTNKKYIEKGPDGSTQITRDGLMNLDLTDEGNQWSIPIAKRVFDKVTYVSRIDDDKYDVTIAWHYQPTPLGIDLKVKDNLRASVGHFVGSGRNWALTNWVTPPTEAPTN